MKTIEILGITKEYKNTKALDNVNLTMEPNKIYGLLGRNGAGKTTLLNLITNRIFPTEGDITIEGVSVFENDEALNNIFYMTEKNLYPEDLRIKNIFRWTKEFYPLFDVEYANRLAEKFELNVNKKVKELSTGYSSIFKSIVALSSNANCIIFDEPILGLDAYHRDVFYKELIANYNDNPKTIILSTHIIEEVSRVLEEVIIIKSGKLIKKESVENLLSNAYMVSGEVTDVNRYIDGKEYVGEELIGNFKSVIVLDSINNRENTVVDQSNLEFSKVELQKLFISLTN